MGKMKYNKNQLRIIGGMWRGRKISFADHDGLRPTGDRIRETLFNWLTPFIEGAECLDLFAGSGALGLEALSRGAAWVAMVDSSELVKRKIESALLDLNAENAQVIKADTKNWLSKPTIQHQGFDIVFLDPPFGTDCLRNCCHMLESNNWLREAASIYIESELPPEQLIIPENWECHRNKKAGMVNYYLFNKT